MIFVSVGPGVRTVVKRINNVLHRQGLLIRRRMQACFSELYYNHRRAIKTLVVAMQR